jgi:ADP-ribose pyrophosphatase
MPYTVYSARFRSPDTVASHVMKRAEILARADCFRGFFRLERVTLRHDLHAGSASPAMTREIWARRHRRRPPIRRRQDRVIGSSVRGRCCRADPWLLEIVAGHIETGEPLEEAARRETLEETGCEARGLTRLATYFLAPHFSPDRVHLFVAEVTAPPESHVCGRGDEAEDIRVVPIDRAEAHALAASGGITSPWTLLALALMATRGSRA